MINFLALFFCYNLFANNCEKIINGTDMMKFDTKIINVIDSCSLFKIVLKHTGKLPKNVMGHNIVILKKSDLDKVISKIKMSHGIENGFLPELNEVLFKSHIVGGGEETTLEINTKKLIKGEDYTFFCSFPGHFMIMQGKVNIL